MSTDAPVDGVQPDETPEIDLERNEGIATVPKRLPKPPAHGFAGSIVINDLGRDAEEIGVDVGQRNLPDGSLYQHARACWYAHEDDADGQSVVLTTEYDPSWSDREDRLAIVLTSSRWRAGQETDRGYRAWYKYDLKLRQVDSDGEATARPPAESLNVKIQPQVDGLVSSEGEPLQLPYGQGTLVSIQTTWVEETAEALDRSLELVQEALGYEHERGTINPESRRLWKAEAHHRFSADREKDVVHTIRQSTDLLARHAADVDERARHDDNVWLEAKITTKDWQQLGFPNLEAPILLKVYRTEEPEKSEFPYNQPKIEAALAGNPGQAKLSWDRWDEILAVLREIVLTHLTWADVGPEEFVADEISDGSTAEPYTFELPQGRREWLREHYESLVPEIYREATKHNTALVYDILEIVRRRETVSYNDLMRETGAAYRTIREHVARLEDLGGDDQPGILRKVQDHVTFVAFSSRTLEEAADDVLDEINPDDTIEDQRRRAEDRRERRLERAEDQAESSETDDVEDEDAASGSAGGTADGSASGNDEDDAEIWRTFGEVAVTGDQLGRALEEEYLEADHVEIRTDPYPLFAD